MPEKSQQESADYRSRDASSLAILGTFFTILSVLVLAGTLWTLDDARAVIVTLVCGGLLLVIGIGTIAASRKIAASKES